jgi:hypothetical protein
MEAGYGIKDGLVCGGAEKSGEGLGGACEGVISEGVRMGDGLTVTHRKTGKIGCEQLLRVCHLGNCEESQQAYIGSSVNASHKQGSLRLTLSPTLHLAQFGF